MSVCHGCGHPLGAASLLSGKHGYCDVTCASRGPSVFRWDWIAAGAPGYDAGPVAARRIWEAAGLPCDPPGQQQLEGAA